MNKIRNHSEDLGIYLLYWKSDMINIKTTDAAYRDSLNMRDDASFQGMRLLQNDHHVSQVVLLERWEIYLRSRAEERSDLQRTGSSIADAPI